MLACSGYRSGSTLQYNLVGEYVERVNGGRRIGLLDPPEADCLWRGLQGIVDAMGLAVAKSHHAVAGFQDFGGAERVWSELGARVQRSEGLAGDPSGSLEELSHLLGLPWVPEAAKAAGLEAQRAVAEKLDSGGTDPRHLVHWDHIADHEGGAWRTAWGAAERELARKELAPLMRRFGYEWG